MSKTIKPRKLVVNFLVLSGGEGISKIFTFVAFAYLARVLGPDTFGDIEFALAVTLFFNMVTEGGLGLLGAREIAKNDNAVHRLTFHIVIMRCFLAIGAFLLLIVFVAISNKSLQEKQLIIFYGLTLFGTPGLLLWVFQGLERMLWVAISSVIRWSLFAGAVFFYISEPSQVWIIPLFELTAIGCVVIFNFCIFRYYFGHFWLRFDYSFSLSLLSQVWPIGLSHIMCGLKIYLPIIMLGLMVGGSEVGWFSSAHRIVIALYALVWMYHFNIHPSIARCTQQSPEVLQRLIGKSLQLTTWVAVFVGVTGVILAKSLIIFTYGFQYSEAVIGFQVLIWLVSFFLISAHYSYILVAYNKQRLELISTVCGVVINLLLNILLIPRYGFLGASCALLCSEVAIWVLLYYFVCREIAIIPFWCHMTRPLIAGTIIAITLLMMPHMSFILAGGIAVLFYGLGLLVLQPGIINDVRTLVVSSRQKL